VQSHLIVICKYYCTHQEVEIVDMAPTPATQGGPVPGVPIPDGALISDDDDSFISVKGITMGIRRDHFPLRALERLVVNKFPKFVPE
jgi:hypothetical protein